MAGIYSAPIIITAKWPARAELGGGRGKGGTAPQGPRRAAGALAAVLLCPFFLMSAATNFNAANYVTILGAGAEMPPSVCITTSKVTLHGRGAALWAGGRARGVLGPGYATAAPFRCWGATKLEASCTMLPSVVTPEEW